MTKPKIGFIGLGLMGSAMVGRLQDFDYPLVVTANRSRPNVDAAVARGAVEVATARDVAAESDIVMLCMDTSESVEARMLGDDGVIAGMKPGTIVVDFGTSLPGSTRMLAEKVAAAGGQYLDAPLGRTPSHAKEGQLNIMGAGDKAAYDQVKPVFDVLGENVFHLGPSGAGHTIKLLNNFLAMTTANVVSEAFATADVAGVSRQDMYNVLSAGPLHSGMMDFIKAYAVDGDPMKLAFAVKNGAKDVGYYAKMTADQGVTSQLAAGPLAMMQEAIADGRGDDMVPEMVEFYVKRFKDAQT